MPTASIVSPKSSPTTTSNLSPNQKKPFLCTIFLLHFLLAFLALIFSIVSLFQTSQDKVSQTQKLLIADVVFLSLLVVAFVASFAYYCSGNLEISCKANADESVSSPSRYGVDGRPQQKQFCGSLSSRPGELDGGSELPESIEESKPAVVVEEEERNASMSTYHPGVASPRGHFAGSKQHIDRKHQEESVSHIGSHEFLPEISISKMQGGGDAMSFFPHPTTESFKVRKPPIIEPLQLPSRHHRTPSGQFSPKEVPLSALFTVTQNEEKAGHIHIELPCEAAESTTLLEPEVDKSRHFPLHSPGGGSNDESRSSISTAYLYTKDSTNSDESTMQRMVCFTASQKSSKEWHRDVSSGAPAMKHLHRRRESSAKGATGATTWLQERRNLSVHVHRFAYYLQQLLLSPHRGHPQLFHIDPESMDILSLDQHSILLVCRPSVTCDQVTLLTSYIVYLANNFSKKENISPLLSWHVLLTVGQLEVMECSGPRLTASSVCCGPVVEELQAMQQLSAYLHVSALCTPWFAGLLEKKWQAQSVSLEVSGVSESTASNSFTSPINPPGGFRPPVYGTRPIDLMAVPRKWLHFPHISRHCIIPQQSNGSPSGSSPIKPTIELCEIMFIDARFPSFGFMNPSSTFTSRGQQDSLHLNPSSGIGASISETTAFTTWTIGSGQTLQTTLSSNNPSIASNVDWVGVDMYEKFFRCFVEGNVRDTVELGQDFLEKYPRDVQVKRLLDFALRVIRQGLPPSALAYRRQFRKNAWQTENDMLTHHTATTTRPQQVEHSRQSFLGSRSAYASFRNGRVISSNKKKSGLGPFNVVAEQIGGMPHFHQQQTPIQTTSKDGEVLLRQLLSRKRSGEGGKKNTDKPQHKICESDSLDSFWSGSSGSDNNNVEYDSQEVNVKDFDSSRREEEPRQQIEDTSKSQWRRSNTVLGRGSTATVYLGMSVRTGELCALKAIPIEMVKGKEAEICKEVKILSNQHHPNLVDYFSYVLTDRHLIILTEYISGGTLHHIVEAFGALPRETCARYLFHLLSGLSYLHEAGFTHRDLKPQNVMLTLDGQCKIADFGTAEHAVDGDTLEASLIDGSLLEGENSSSVQLVQGSPLFMAPEQAMGHATQRSDIWAVGLVTYYLLSATLPYPPEVLSMNPLQFIFKITQDETFVPVAEIEDEEDEEEEENRKDEAVSISPRTPGYLANTTVLPRSKESTADWKEEGGKTAKRREEKGKEKLLIQDWLKSCFQRDAEKRPTAKELLQHPWLKLYSSTAAKPASKDLGSA